MSIYPSCKMEQWEGRVWVEASPLPVHSDDIPKLRIVTYRPYSDFKTAFMHHSVHKAWENRSKLLLAEIQNYDADILCLLDIDHFQDFWYPKLMSLGYDSVHRQRTQEKDFHYDGILIAIKRERLQVFKSEWIDFNRALTNESKGSVFRERCKTDDVALVTFIQTIQSNDLPTSVCVACAMFNELTSNQDVRTQHAQYLAQEIEKMNRDFHAPVIICTNLNDIPGSGPYSLLRTGRLPLVPQVPPRPNNVRATPTSRASAMISWLPPKISIADPTIISYRISWRPGGSTTLGFRSQIEAAAGDCIKYVEKLDENNRRKVVALEELQYHVLGLVAEMPYEFRVCGVNEIGEGVWSIPCAPIVLPNPDKAPNLPPLPTFASLERVLESRECDGMGLDDINIHDVLRIDPTNPTTSLTPRRIDGSINRSITQGRVLPLQANLRLGWKEDLNGQIDSSLTAELNREYILSKSLLRDHQGFKERSWNMYNDLEIKSDFMKQNGTDVYKKLLHGDDGSSFLLDGREVLNHLGEPNRRHIHSLLLRSAYESYSSSGEPIFNTCHPKERETQGVDCADYIFYSTTGFVAHKILAVPTIPMMRRGETPEETLTVSDICHLEPFQSLSSNFDKLLQKSYEKIQYQGENRAMGNGNVNRNDNGQRVHKHTASDIHQMKRMLKELLIKSHGPKASEISANSSGAQQDIAGLKQGQECAFWGGRWTPFPIPNKLKGNCFLPSAAFPSTHFAIGLELVIDENQLSTCLRQGAK